MLQQLVDKPLGEMRRVVSVYDSSHVVVRVGQDSVLVSLLPNSKPPQVDDQVLVFDTRSGPIGVALWAPQVYSGSSMMKLRDKWVFQGFSIVDSYPTDTTTFIASAALSGKIEWQLKDTDANTTGVKDTTWEVSVPCTIISAAVYNPAKPAANCTTAVSIWRATTTDTTITWDGATLNNVPFGPTATPRQRVSVGAWTAVSLNAGDLLAVEITTADASLTALVVTLEVLPL